MSDSDAEQLRRRNHELSILNAIARALNQEVALERALHAVLAQVAALLDLQTGWIWLLREEGDSFYLAAAQNLPPALTDVPSRMEGDCYCQNSYLAGDLEGAANVNVVTCSRLKWLEGGTAGLRYHASIPLYAHDTPLGVLNVASADWQELAPSTLRLLHIVGDLLSIAVERARLFARSARLGAAEERNRLAREIHDTLAQGLSATALQLEAADALLETGSPPERIRPAIGRALEITRSNLEETRRSVLDLRAAPLEGRSLSEALAVLLEERGREGGFDVEFDAVSPAHPLTVRVEVGLYRIAQEALTNVTRHAGASRVALRLVGGPETIELTIEDDGEGFDPATIGAGQFGLVGLNERVKLLGGRLALWSSAGEGTRLCVTIPTERPG